MCRDVELIERTPPAQRQLIEIIQAYKRIVRAIRRAERKEGDGGSSDVRYA
jgi:hypothetical protein